MKKYFFVIVSLIGLLSCSSKPFLVKKLDQTNLSSPNAFCYLDHKGKTIVPLGRYSQAYTDTVVTIGFVGNNQSEILAIDIYGKELFQVFKNDGLPDYESNRLFRIIKDQKIGYADMMGKIVVKPSYKCAFPFFDGRAKVSINCETVTKGDYSYWNSDNWVFINKKGQVLPN